MSIRPSRPQDAQPSSLGLRRIKLLEGLSEKCLDDLARACAWRNYEAGQYIISREADDREVYLLVSGRIRVTSYSAGGRQVTFQDIDAGELFGEVAAIDELPRSADVIALDPSLLAVVPPELFIRLLHEQPVLAGRVLRRLAGMVRRLTDRVFDLSTQGVQRRIQAELLRLAQASGVKGNRARIDPAPKHADIASQVSTYREQVTRELSAMAKAGLVARDGRALVVPDVRRLQAAAHGEGDEG